MSWLTVPRRWTSALKRSTEQVKQVSGTDDEDALDNLDTQVLYSSDTQSTTVSLCRNNDNIVVKTLSTKQRDDVQMTLHECKALCKLDLLRQQGQSFALVSLFGIKNDFSSLRRKRIALDTKIYMERMQGNLDDWASLHLGPMPKRIVNQRIYSACMQIFLGLYANLFNFSLSNNDAYDRNILFKREEHRQYAYLFPDNQIIVLPNYGCRFTLIDYGLSSVYPDQPPVEQKRHKPVDMTQVHVASVENFPFFARDLCAVLWSFAMLSFAEQSVWLQLVLLHFRQGLSEFETVQDVFQFIRDITTEPFLRTAHLQNLLVTQELLEKYYCNAQLQVIQPEKPLHEKRVLEKKAEWKDIKRTLKRQASLL